MVPKLQAAFFVASVILVICGSEACVTTAAKPDGGGPSTGIAGSSGGVGVGGLGERPDRAYQRPGELIRHGDAEHEQQQADTPEQQPGPVHPVARPTRSVSAPTGARFPVARIITPTHPPR